MEEVKYFNTFIMRVLIKLRSYTYIKENINHIRNSKDKIKWKLISSTEMPEEFIDLLSEFLDYRIVSIAQTLSESFIDNNKEKLDMKLISKYQKLSIEYIDANLSTLYFPYLLMYQDSITTEFINSKKDIMSESDWQLVSKFRTLSESFMTENLDRLNIRLLLKYQNFSYSYYLATFKNHPRMSYKYLINNKNLVANGSTFFIEDNLRSEFIGKIPYNWIFTKVPVSVSFLEEYKCYLKTKIICKYQVLSEAFIHKYRYWLNWHYICKYQILSEAFMESHLEFLDFKLVSKYQTLSETFMDTHFDKLDANYITKHQKSLSETFLRRYINKLHPVLLVIYQENLMSISELDGNSPFDVMPGKQESLFRILAKYQPLSAARIEDYADRLDWDFVSRYQQLSPADIVYFKDKLNWTLVCRFQDIMSSNLVKDISLRELIDFRNVAMYQDLSGNDSWVLDNLNGIFKGLAELLYYYGKGLSAQTKDILIGSFIN